MDADDMPMDIRTAAAAGHEYYTSLCDAGFTPHAALYLTACLMCGGPKPPDENPK